MSDTENNKEGEGGSPRGVDVFEASVIELSQLSPAGLQS